MAFISAIANFLEPLTDQIISLNLSVAVLICCCSEGIKTYLSSKGKVTPNLSSGDGNAEAVPMIPLVPNTNKSLLVAWRALPKTCPKTAAVSAGYLLALKAAVNVAETSVSVLSVINNGLPLVVEYN